ncbi:unnamed protein product, partial [Notodromas monacha]
MHNSAQNLRLTDEIGAKNIKLADARIFKFRTAAAEIMRFAAALIVAMMMMMMVAAGDQRRYDGYQVLRFKPESRLHMSIMDQLFKDSPQLGLDFWSEPSKLGNDVDILVKPDATEAFAKMAARLGMEHSVLIKDVQSVIDSQPVAELGSKLTWDAYYQFEDILAWTEEMRDAFPDIVTLQSIGESYEGREIRLM